MKVRLIGYVLTWLLVAASTAAAQQGTDAVGVST